MGKRPGKKGRRRTQERQEQVVLDFGAHQIALNGQEVTHNTYQTGVADLTFSVSLVSFIYSPDKSN